MPQVSLLPASLGNASQNIFNHSYVKTIPVYFCMMFCVLNIAVVFTFVYDVIDVFVETFPRAQNVTWNSINFKTMLTWSPKPKDYSYTVEFYV